MHVAVGDIIRCDAPITDHAKFHLCVLECGDDGQAACFLFLNSENKWKGDCVFQNHDFPCIPSSRTGLTVVSFSSIPRYNAKQLKNYRAKIVGRITPSVAQALVDFAKTVPTLTVSERRVVLAGLARIR